MPPPPPETPKYRFLSPEDVLRPRSGPPKFNLGVNNTGQANTPVAKAGFATPAPPLTKRQPVINSVKSGKQFGSFEQRRRGFSPDPDLMTPKPVRAGTTASSRVKRRRSFDLDEIDEALLSGTPKVLGPSSSGLKYTGFLDNTPVLARGSQIAAGNIRPSTTQATPTPAAKRQPLFQKESSVILSSPPRNLDLSFGDTQEDVQDDSELDEKTSGLDQNYLVPQRKKRKSAGVFDDIESIASSLPSRIGNHEDDDGTNVEPEGMVRNEKEDGEQEEMDVSESDIQEITVKSQINQKENDAPFRSKGNRRFPRDPLTPPKPILSFASDLTDGEILGTMSTAKKWITVPNRPQINFPQLSPSAKLNKAISAMAWSPSHRRRRNANSKYLTGGLASTVLGWAFDAQDSVLRNNAIMEQTPHLLTGTFVVAVELLWEEDNYVAVVGAAEYQINQTQDGELPVQNKLDIRQAKVILIGDSESMLRKKLKKGSRIEVRAPMWDIAVTDDDDRWTVAINWSSKVFMPDTITD